MIPSKLKVVEVLKEVVYFPKGDNIINLKMVDDIQLEENLIRFRLLFEKLEDEKNQILIDTATQMLKAEFGDIEIDIIAASQENSLSKVKHIIAVASGKGGVGKSTVAVNLAIGLALQGMRVGLLDADIYGPSIPVMFGNEETRPLAYENEGKSYMIPIEKYGVKMLSIGHLVDKDMPLIWRGPMASNALSQLLLDTDWGELDYMVIDMPPGTGDIQLCLAQNFKLSGSIIVTTPQKVAFADVRRAANMFRHEGVNVPILGLVENMAYFTPSDMPEKKYYIFGKNTGKAFAEELDLPLLAQIPIDENVSEANDSGTPFSHNKFSPVTAAFRSLANKVIEML
ncbi:MAG: Mrp/NBP35 family ATP-binding protein [Bacteroidales bacterium]|nr:Mrp/NBP35 family ATP-binding protein [Bacteroidales bacterium]